MLSTIALSVLGLTVGAVGLVHAKVKISSVLVHHATHGKGSKHPRLNRVLAEAMSILALSTPFAEYKRVHDGHHRNSSFASMQDEEARYLFDLGFQPGTAQAELWRTLWRTLWSPRFHAMSIGARARLNFGQGPLPRLAAAWTFWLSVLAGAAIAGWLTAFAIGVLVPLLIGGNIGSFLELASRHRWLVTPEAGSRRQFVLSHGRFLAPMPPDRRDGVRVWARWALGVAVSALSRLIVVPGDLNWHIAHHTGLVPAARRVEPAWTDAAGAYSTSFWSDSRLRQQSHASILQAIGHWFAALEAEPRHADDRRGGASSAAVTTSHADRT